ncbi:helix-turn-helix transcriptional regulator [Acinetobacter haemolyticus]|uniref:helix-turn-helix domain-containing protein n=1 Tax=Acinetobacter haemolyticus TaxID=29430 RepID=UPI000F755E58|nr:XRE family transcriptional regulator [Acinetobacter haemolyticus]AZN69127.1 XRE family transcriptional regulator [Acinetobacter haemolyticus]
MNSIGLRIDRKCKELKITIPELADMSGINYKTLNRTMTVEKPNPTLEQLKKLSIALGMSIDNIVFGENESIDSEISIILNDIKSIEKEDKKRILYMVRMMIAESKNRK